MILSIKKACGHELESRLIVTKTSLKSWKNFFLNGKDLKKQDSIDAQTAV